MKIRPGMSIKYHTDNREWEYSSKRWAERYAAHRVVTISRITKRIKSVLDVGCGGGMFLRQWEEVKYRTGCDCNTGTPKGLIDGIRFVHYPIERFPEKEKYTLVTAFHVLEHVDGVVAAFKKLARLTGKFVAVEVPVTRSMKTWTGHVHGFTRKSFWKLRQLVEPRFETLKVCDGPQTPAVMWIAKTRKRYDKSGSD
jgi:2-polyprenyl-3-methyl-5-hydroxy-6-metoxy-1,4-benzoquinol methylase